LVEIHPFLGASAPQRKASRSSPIKSLAGGLSETANTSSGGIWNSESAVSTYRMILKPGPSATLSRTSQEQANGEENEKVDVGEESLSTFAPQDGKFQFNFSQKAHILLLIFSRHTVQ
jgi:hypothetical protein